MPFLSSHVSQPTRHLQGTPLQPFLHFLGPSFSALVPLRYLSTTPTLNTFVPLTQWSTSYSPLFVGKTHQVTSRLAPLAMDLAALRLLAYPRDSMTGFVATQPCSRNQPLDQGSTTGSNAVEPVSAPSAPRQATANERYFFRYPRVTRHLTT